MGKGNYASICKDKRGEKWDKGKKKENSGKH